MLVSSLQILEIPENKHFLIKSYMYMYVTKMKLIKRRDAYVIYFLWETSVFNSDRYIF